MRALAALARYVAPSTVVRAGERCELCSIALDEAHMHVVDLERQRLLCTCRGCHMLFTQRGASGGRFRAVPARYRHAPKLALTRARWEGLQIPVRLAFFFHSTPARRCIAFYPGPAGACESLIDLGVWDQLVSDNPVLGELEPDVEALLVRGDRGGDHFDCYLVPIHSCYELVGRVKLRWRGFDGGEEAWSDIDGFFASLRERCEEVGADAGAASVDGSVAAS